MIYILVGGKIREAHAARFTATKSAIVYGESGPMEFAQWYASRAKAEAALKKPATA